MATESLTLLTKAQALDFVATHAALFDQAEPHNPFAGAAWTQHFIEQIATDAWTFALARHPQDSHSLMLLQGERATPHRRAALANYYTGLVSPLLSPLDAPALRHQAIALLAQVVRQQPGLCCLALAPLDADSADTAGLQQALFDAGWYVKRYACFGNWYLPCAGQSFQQYMAARSSRLVHTWNRKRRLFEQGGQARIEIVQTAQQLPRAMDAYAAIYARSWKQAEPYPHFVRDWALVCARKGWLRLGLAWLGDTPVAAQFWFTAHGRAYIFKLAYDEDHARLSAGTVLSGHLFRHALDVDRVQEIDYLSGDDAYKQLWMTHRRQRVGLIAHNPRTLRGLLASAREIAADLSRPLRQRLRSQ